MMFPKRIKEPKIMEKIEMEVFEELSKENYKRWLIPLADDALEQAHLTEGKILDVGCGPGLLSKELGQRSIRFHITGIDISPFAIRLAKKNCKKQGNVTFKIGSIYHLPFGNESFDLVICKDSLHHFNSTEKALSEMMRVLKGDGLLYIQDLRRDLPEYLLKRSIPSDTVLKKLQFYSVRAAYTKSELENMLQQLEINTYTIHTRRVTHTLKKQYKRSGINFEQLREGFQARYVATIKK